MSCKKLVQHVVCSMRPVTWVQQLGDSPNKLASFMLVSRQNHPQVPLAGDILEVWVCFQGHIAEIPLGGLRAPSEWPQRSISWPHKRNLSRWDSCVFPGYSFWYSANKLKALILFLMGRTVSFVPGVCCCPADPGVPYGQPALMTPEPFRPAF